MPRRCQCVLSDLDDHRTATVDICRLICKVPVPVHQVSVLIATFYHLRHGSLRVRLKIVVLRGTRIRHSGWKIGPCWTVILIDIG